MENQAAYELGRQIAYAVIAVIFGGYLIVSALMTFLKRRKNNK